MFHYNYPMQSLPGGMNHLQRIYREVQEPLMSATTPENPFADLANSSSTGAYHNVHINKIVIVSITK